MHAFDPTELQGDVLLALNPDERTHLVEVARAAGISTGAARSRLTYLEQKHCVVAAPKPGGPSWDRNWWVLTENGRQHRDRLVAGATADVPIEGLRILKRAAGAKRMHTLQCSTGGCIHSASYEAILLGAHWVPLCSGCAGTWEKTYEHALFGWPDEVDELEPQTEVVAA